MVSQIGLFRLPYTSKWHRVARNPSRIDGVMIACHKRTSRYSSSEPCQVSVTSRPTSNRGDAMGVRFIPSPNETTKPAAGTCPF
jgi:lipocalin